MQQVASMSSTMSRSLTPGRTILLTAVIRHTAQLSVHLGFLRGLDAQGKGKHPGGILILGPREGLTQVIIIRNGSDSPEYTVSTVSTTFFETIVTETHYGGSPLIYSAGMIPRSSFSRRTRKTLSSSRSWVMAPSSTAWVRAVTALSRLCGESSKSTPAWTAFTAISPLP